jgi:hypothetical protein
LNVAVVFPAGIVIVAGTVAAEVSELVSVTTNPPAGAAAVRMTVPVTVVAESPLTDAGDTETESTAGGRRVSVACCELEP